MTLELPEMTAALLRQQAGGKRLSVSTLAAKLLETIVQDGLYDAVLDNGEAAKRLSGEHKILTLDATPAEAAATEEHSGHLRKRRAA